ncbi:MAG: hypothetical protein R3C02_05415 [Planctomycetaceae bacterium]
MSAKPSAKPAKPAPVKVPRNIGASDTSEAAATPVKPVGKPKSIKQAIAEQPDPEDDPFDVDTSAVSQAPPVDYRARRRAG